MSTVPSATYKPLPEFKAKQVAVTGPVHGEKGLYCGGDFVDIEECGPLYANPSGARYQRRPAANDDSSEYDVVVIGAGCVGGMIARELSRYQLRVLLVEKADDVTQGATKGNSGVVHAGYDDTPGSVRAQYCPRGARLFPALDRELHFGFVRHGSLVCAMGEADERHLTELLERGRLNGVQNLRIVRGAELREMEPNLAPSVTAALHARDAGIVTPYEFAIALCENAVDNGVQLALHSEVVALQQHADHSFTVQIADVAPAPAAPVAALSPSPLVLLSSALVAIAVAVASTSLLAAAGLVLVAIACLGLVFIQSRGTATTLLTKTRANDPKFAEKLLEQRKAAAPGATRSVKAAYVVNCAGLFSDRVAAMVGDTSFKIKPRFGEYILLHKNQGSKLVRHVLFPCPGPLGKGVLVQPTLWGNLILGPTARDLHNPTHMAQSYDSILTYILTQCRRLVPYFDPTQVIHTFAGARAKSSTGDWTVQASLNAPHMVHVAGIDSPGLAGSPALGLRAVELLQEAGLPLRKDPEFEPRRGAIVRAKNGWKNLKIAKDLNDAATMDPACAVICRCEKVTEAEITDAISRSLPCASTQAVRKRTRAGMGHCQGERCGGLVQEIIARELNVAQQEVPRRPWPESSMLPQRWLNPAQQRKFLQLAEGE